MRNSNAPAAQNFYYFTLFQYIYMSRMGDAFNMPCDFYLENIKPANDGQMVFKWIQ